MDATTLVDADIINGRTTVEAIKAVMPVRQAFWAHFTGPEEWRLVIVTPLADTAGPMAAYAAVQRAIRANTFPLRRISIIGLSEPLAKLLTDAPTRPGWPGTGPVTLTSSARSTTSGGVDSVYIYPKR